MGMFGSGAAAMMVPTVDPNAQGQPLSMQDKLGIFLQAMRGDYAGAAQMKRAPMIAAQRGALSKQIDALLGGQPTSTADQVNAPQVGLNPPQSAETQAVPISDPRWSRAALMAPQLGLDLNGVLKLQEMNKPQYEEGVRVNPYSPTAPAFIPKRTEGVQPNFGPGGQLASMSTIPGAPEAAGDMAGAIANRQEQAKSFYDLVDVPQSDGSIRKMPRFLAVQALSGQGGPASPQLGSTGGGGGAGGGSALPGPTLGVSQNPAATELQKLRAQTQGQREALEPKQSAALQSLEQRSSLTSQIIHQMLGDTQDPKSGQWAPGGKPMINGMTAGFMANFAGVKGLPPHNLEAQLDHVRAMTALDELEKLRADSPTGAGLGQLDQIRSNRQQEYSATYGNIRPTAPNLGGGSAPRVSAPPSAIGYLRQHPELAGQFDAKYGPGSSRSVLGR